MRSFLRTIAPQPVWASVGTLLVLIGVLVIPAPAQAPRPPAGSLRRAPAVVLPDPARVYELERWVLGPPPPRLDLTATAPVAAGPVAAAAVPEPALCWILMMTMACALYLPPRSW